MAADPVMPHPVPEQLAELVAARFRVLGEPMRIRLLDRLRDGEATIGELAEALGTSQQNVSKHVHLLADDGVVARERRGTATVCSIADPAVFELCSHVCGGIRQRNAQVAALVEDGDADSTGGSR